MKEEKEPAPLDTDLRFPRKDTTIRVAVDTENRLVILQILVDGTVAHTAGMGTPAARETMQSIYKAIRMIEPGIIPGRS